MYEFSEIARLVSPVGCPECSGVAFCGRECQELACGTYHKAECHFLNLFIGLGMSVLCHLALRIVARTGNETETFLSAYTTSIFRSALSNTCLRPGERERESEINLEDKQTAHTGFNDAAMCQAPFLQFAVCRALSNIYLPLTLMRIKFNFQGKFDQ
jgi:MYND finger